MSKAIAEFNDLVRQAFDAQEAFDLWDDGITFSVFGRERHVDLDTIVREWNEANAALIDHVLKHGAPLKEKGNG